MYNFYTQYLASYAHHNLNKKTIEIKVKVKGEKMQKIDGIEPVHKKILETLGIHGALSENTIFHVGNFDVEVSSGISHKCKNISFWLVGQKERKYTKLELGAGTGDCLTVFTEKNEEVLNSSPTLPVIGYHPSITIRDGFNAAYPKVWREYTGGDFLFGGKKFPDSIEKGDLVFFRVDIDERQFANYQRNELAKSFRVRHITGGDLSAFGLPEKLEDAEKVFGIPIIKNIDFDQKVEEIIRNSELEKFLKELGQLEKQQT